ncbi:MAG: hypothetical protein O2816_05465 [Planctomycetota bacterium]|nr:hypothetical protein [Planctomycetota bacterium]
MNPLKIVLPILLVIGGIVVWQFSPGVRSSVRDRLADLGAWTEKARKEDPQGFMNFAIDKLKGDQGKFKEAKLSLAAAGKRAEEQRDSSDKKAMVAAGLLERMNTAYATAEGGAGYPIAFAVMDGGQPTQYDRNEFLNQVQLLLAQKRTHEENVENLGKLLEAVDQKSIEISTRTTEIQGRITELETKLEFVKLKQLTDGVESLMSDVYGLLEENAELDEVDSDPVRSLDDLIDAMEKGEAAVDPKAESGFADALKFLEG